MGMRGPKHGAGDITAWVIGALGASDKTVPELMMGCPYKLTSVKTVVNRLKLDGVVLEVVDENKHRMKRAIEGGKRCQIFRLNEEVDVADSSSFPAQQGRTNAVRGLENAFQGIVARRVATG